MAKTGTGSRVTTCTTATKATTTTIGTTNTTGDAVSLWSPEIHLKCPMSRDILHRLTPSNWVWMRGRRGMGAKLSPSFPLVFLNMADQIACETVWVEVQFPWCHIHFLCKLNKGINNAVRRLISTRKNELKELNNQTWIKLRSNTIG